MSWCRDFLKLSECQNGLRSLEAHTLWNLKLIFLVACNTFRTEYQKKLHNLLHLIGHPPKHGSLEPHIAVGAQRDCIWKCVIGKERGLLYFISGVCCALQVVCAEQCGCGKFSCSTELTYGALPLVQRVSVPKQLSLTGKKRTTKVGTNEMQVAAPPHPAVNLKFEQDLKRAKSQQSFFTAWWTHLFQNSMLLILKMTQMRMH